MGSSVTRAALQNLTPPGTMLPNPLYLSLPPAWQGLSYRWYILPIEIDNVGVGLSSTGNGNIDQSYVGFASWAGSVSIRQNVAGFTPAPTDPARVSIFDNAGNGYQPNQGQTDSAIETVFSVTGASEPSVWMAPILISGGAGIQIKVTNQHNAHINNYSFALSGILISRS